jgi:uncharacterized protein (DUF58 family)
MANAVKSAVSARRPSWRFWETSGGEVWLRFFLALAGLILAFAAALFSSIANDAGNVWSSRILASAALIMAAFVGITTVPYLARRVALERIHDALQYEVTREGLAYVAIALLLGIAALNTGNNLLYIVVGTMLAAIVVSGIASAAVLRYLELDVRLPEHIFAGQTVTGRINIHNPRRFLASYSISVVPPKAPKRRRGWRWEPATFGFPARRPPANQWIRLPDRVLRRVAQQPDPPVLFKGPIYFPHVAPRTTLSADLELHFDRRGRYAQDSLGISTRFPFSFLRKTRRVPLAREVIVFPAVQATDEFFEVLPLITGEFETFVRGRGFDLYRIREYMPEDTARHVDWKATAKSGSLKVREFSREDERKLRIVFDNPPPGLISEQAYERAVALAASFAFHFTQENTDTSFAAPGYAGGSELYNFLSYLAVVEPWKGDSILDTLPVSDDYNLVLTARPPGSVPSALSASSYFVFLDQRG